MFEYPDNPAPTNLPILDEIRRRWSPLNFSSEPIEEEKIATLFEAARFAPSSFNEQPWRYIYATNDDRDHDARGQLESLLNPGNSYAKGAYLLMISFAKKTFTKNGKENVHFLHDLGMANGFIVLQCVDLGLIGHQMAGFAREKANALLGVPSDFFPGDMMAIGYPGDPSTLPAELMPKQMKTRVRKDRKEFVFRGKWMG